MKPIPRSMSENFRIYCHLLRERGFLISQISAMTGKNRKTILYHLEKYEGLLKFDKNFPELIEKFNEDEFVKRFQKQKKGTDRRVHPNLPVKTKRRSENL